MISRTFDNLKQKVVIIGHSYTSRLSLIRSVAQIGCEITVIVMTGFKRDGKTLNNRKPIDCSSKYISHVFYCLRSDKETFIRLLLEQCTDLQQKVVLIPDSDDTVVAIDNNQERLKDYFVFPHICKQRCRAYLHIAQRAAIYGRLTHRAFLRKLNLYADILNADIHTAYGNARKLFDFIFYRADN